MTNKRSSKRHEQIEQIRRLQKELASPYSNSKPSKVYDVSWLYAERHKGTYPKPTKRSGKWLVYVDQKNIDEVWQKIKRATEEGLLGDRSKVSTALPNPNASRPNKHVVCVYTYDFKDEEDVRCIREQLRKLGIVAKIPYKSDEVTLKRKYVVTGHKRISIYFE